MSSGSRTCIAGLAVAVVTAAIWATQQEPAVKLTVLGGLGLLVLLWGHLAMVDTEIDRTEHDLSAINARLTRGELEASVRGR